MFGFPLTVDRTHRHSHNSAASIPELVSTLKVFKGDALRFSRITKATPATPNNNNSFFLISTTRQAYYLHRLAAAANPLSGEHFPSFNGHTAVLHVCARCCTDVLFQRKQTKPIAYLRPRTRPTAPQLGDIIKRIVSPIMAEGGTEDLPSLQEPQLRPVDITPSGGWDNFYHWLCCVCVVTFDLELGQALEVG